MTRLHAANRYDRLTHDLGAITGSPQQVSVNLLLLTLSHSSQKQCSKVSEAP
jgi:hypothetical protein